MANESDFKLTKGSLKTYTYKGDSGKHSIPYSFVESVEDLFPAGEPFSQKRLRDLTTLNQWSDQYHKANRSIVTTVPTVPHTPITTRQLWVPRSWFAPASCKEARDFPLRRRSLEKTNWSGSPQSRKRFSKVLRSDQVRKGHQVRWLHQFAAGIRFMVIDPANGKLSCNDKQQYRIIFITAVGVS